MKNFISPWILMLTLIFAAFFSYAQDSSVKDKSDKVNQPKILPYFNRIVLTGIGNLYITQAKKQSLVVKGEAYLLPNIQAVVEGDILHLGFKNASEHSRAELNYYLNIKELKSIQSSSSASIFIQDGLTADELTLEIKSFGEMNVKLNVQKLIAKIEGAGRIKAKGQASAQEIYINGAGEFFGNDLRGDSVSVNITGTGTAKINAVNNLSVAIPQDGAVRYCGKPSVSKEVSNKAIIEALPDKEC